MMARRQSVSGSHRRQGNSSLDRQFTPFSRLPLELRVMIWKMALGEHGCLVVMKSQADYTSFRSLPQVIGPGHEVAPLLLVNHEASEVAMSLIRGFIQPVAYKKSFVGHLGRLYPTVPPIYAHRCIGCNTDMFYVPIASELPALLKAITKGSFAHQLERLAVTIFGSTSRDDKYIAGGQFENDIRGLPKLRQLYLVVDDVFNVDFGPGHVPSSRSESARLPYRTCPDHVTCRTALREHIRNQEDVGFGFVDYEMFMQRWQWPIASKEGTHISFEVYNAYCHRVLARVHEIAQKLHRPISVKLVIDIDGKIYTKFERQSSPIYKRSDMHFWPVNVNDWYRIIRAQTTLPSQPSRRRRNPVDLESWMNYEYQENVQRIGGIINGKSYVERVSGSWP